MLVSYQWLKEYVDVDLSALELAEKITRAGVEIGGVRHLSEGLSGIVIAEVVSVLPHPDSDRLHLCQVTTDGNNRIQVVCGAANVETNQKVVFAPVGATLPGDVHIGQVMLRGIESNGMICSMQELGIADDLVAAADKDGIRVLPEDAPIGDCAITYLGLDDWVFEVDLTPNRSDCLSVYNIAREIGALIEQPVRPVDVDYQAQGKQTTADMSVEIQAPELCQRYVGALIRDCKDRRSPIWMEHRLQCAGIRPISFLVDVTNYVMLELGQPLHAFDYQNIAGSKIIVRRADKGEKIVTLDDKERALNEEMLLITDAERAVGVAGVMGGANTEIQPNTRDVFLESAWFEPRNVRRTSLALGLRTEASIRNEKGLNPETVDLAAKRAAALIQRFAEGKVAPEMIDEYPVPHEAVIVRLRFDACNALLGTEITPEFMIHVLERLQFEPVKQEDDAIVVAVPGWRPDVTIEEDLIEEVARIYGYDEIPSSLPYGATHPGVLTSTQRLRRLITDRLAMRGLHEVINYSFTREKVLDDLQLTEGDSARTVIAIDNALSEEMAIMRTGLISGLLDSIKLNQRHDITDVAIFEMGRLFLGGPELDVQALAEEPEYLGIALTGGTQESWHDKREKYDFHYLKGLLEDLIASLYLPELRFTPLTDHPSWHPGRSARLWFDEQYLGILGEVHPLVLKAWGIKNPVIAAELNMQPIFRKGLVSPSAMTPARYPAISRDLALLVREDISHAEVAKVIRHAASNLLKSIRLFDVYSGEQVAPGEKSLAYALRFQSDSETLTDETIEIEMKKIVSACQKECEAKLRLS